MHRGTVISPLWLAGLIVTACAACGPVEATYEREWRILHTATVLAPLAPEHAGPLVAEGAVAFEGGVSGGAVSTTDTPRSQGAAGSVLPALVGDAQLRVGVSERADFSLAGHLSMGRAGIGYAPDTDAEDLFGRAAWSFGPRGRVLAFDNGRAQVGFGGGVDVIGVPVYRQVIERSELTIDGDPLDDTPIGEDSGDFVDRDVRTFSREHRRHALTATVSLFARGQLSDRLSLGGGVQGASFPVVDGERIARLNCTRYADLTEPYDWVCRGRRKLANVPVFEGRRWGATAWFDVAVRLDQLVIVAAVFGSYAGEDQSDLPIGGRLAVRWEIPAGKPRDR